MAFGPFLLKSVFVSEDSLVLELADANGTVKYRPKRKLLHDGSEATRIRAEQLIGELVTTETIDPLRWPPKDWWAGIAPFKKPRGGT